MANNVRQFKLTAEGLKQREEELDYLKSVKRRDIADKIKVALSFGDLSENSEYDEAKTEQGKLYSRIAELKDLIENAEIVEKQAAPGHDGVNLGSRVTILDMDENEEEVYEIVGSQEANPLKGRISDDSPIGQALFGHTAGDTIELETEMGVLKFKVIEVANN